MLGEKVGSGLVLISVGRINLLIKSPETLWRFVFAFPSAGYNFMDILFV